MKETSQLASESRSGESGLFRWLGQKVRNGAVQLRYLFGDDTPARVFLAQFQETATRQPVPGRLGKLRGHGSQTVVVDFDPAAACAGSGLCGSGALVLKFEAWPGVISARRLAEESENEQLARKYLDRFMPSTLRVIGHGLRNEPSALCYQQRVEGKPLRLVRCSTIASNAELGFEFAKFCKAVLTMSQETGQIPDLAGTLPHVDHLSNLFWWSRNVVVDVASSRVWLVDTGWKRDEESLRDGKLRSRARTWIRLQSMRLFCKRVNYSWRRNTQA